MNKGSQRRLIEALYVIPECLQQWLAFYKDWEKPKHHDMHMETIILKNTTWFRHTNGSLSSSP